MMAYGARALVATVLVLAAGCSASGSGEDVASPLDEYFAGAARVSYETGDMGEDGAPVDYGKSASFDALSEDIVQSGGARQLESSHG